MAMEQLLELLQDDAKLTTAQLAVMLGEKEEDVAAAIKRYEKDGVIKGYQALVNWERKTIQRDEVPFTFTSHKFLEVA